MFGYKVLYLISGVIILGLIVYVHGAYASIYRMIGGTNLTSPTTAIPSLVGNNPNGKIPLTYVALGDSLTAGVGASRVEDSYPYQFATDMASAYQGQVKLINLGIPGATAADVVREALPQLSVLQPDVVTLLIGVNDVHNRTGPDNFAANVAMIADNSQVKKSRFIVLTIPYIGDPSLMKPPLRMYFDFQTKRYNHALRSFLANRSADIVDLYSLTHASAISGDNYYAADLFHPSAAAYTTWATYLYDHYHK